MAMHKKHGAGLAVAVILVIIGIMAWMNSSASEKADAAKNPGTVPPAPPLQAAGEAVSDWWTDTQLWIAAQRAAILGEGVTS